MLHGGNHGELLEDAPNLVERRLELIRIGALPVRGQGRDRRWVDVGRR